MDREQILARMLKIITDCNDELVALLRDIVEETSDENNA